MLQNIGITGDYKETKGFKGIKVTEEILRKMEETTDKREVNGIKGFKGIKVTKEILRKMEETTDKRI